MALMVRLGHFEAVGSNTWTLAAAIAEGHLRSVAGGPVKPAVTALWQHLTSAMFLTTIPRPNSGEGPTQQGAVSSQAKDKGATSASERAKAKVFVGGDRNGGHW